MKITRIQVYGRTRVSRSRMRSIGFEAEPDESDNIEAETLILQGRVDRQLVEWQRSLDETDAQIAREEHEKMLTNLPESFGEPWP